MRMGVNFYEEISDKLVLVHLLVWVNQLYKNAR
jgi:hypothetical protein